jgi:Tfp pilus assembly protein PilZ
MLDILGYVFLAWMAFLSAAGLIIMTKVTWEIVKEIFLEN